MRGFCALALVTLVLGAPEAGAQTPLRVEGTVVATTGEPIAGAIVRAEGSTVGALTDARGHYSMTLPAGTAATLVAQRVGYAVERRLIPAGAAAPFRVDFVLAEEAIEMAGLVVSATRELRLRRRRRRRWAW